MRQDKIRYDSKRYDKIGLRSNHVFIGQLTPIEVGAHLLWSLGHMTGIGAP